MFITLHQLCLLELEGRFDVEGRLEIVSHNGNSLQAQNRLGELNFMNDRNVQQKWACSSSM